MSTNLPDPEQCPLHWSHEDESPGMINWEQPCENRVEPGPSYWEARGGSAQLAPEQLPIPYLLTRKENKK